MYTRLYTCTQSTAVQAPAGGPGASDAPQGGLGLWVCRRGCLRAAGVGDGGYRPQGGVPGGEVPADSQRRRGTATDANVLQSTWRALGRSETDSLYKYHRYLWSVAAGVAGGVLVPVRVQVRVRLRAVRVAVPVRGTVRRARQRQGTGARGLLADAGRGEKRDGQADRDSQQGSFRVEGVSSPKGCRGSGCFGGEGLAGDGLCCIVLDVLCSTCNSRLGERWKDSEGYRLI